MDDDERTQEDEHTISSPCGPKGLGQLTIGLPV